MKDALMEQFSGVSRELSAYLCRLVIRPQIAAELLQTTYLRCLEASDRLPNSQEGIRAWLFKVASNLAIDELRRHGHWRETLLSDLREVAESSVSFMEQSRAMAGNPESKAIAREHLVACLACTMRNLPERRAAALLLKEVHGFSLAETADMLEATQAQVKNWLQEGRAIMTQKYGTSCALLVKEGVCHQCVELDGLMSAGQGNPLVMRADLDQRFKIAVGLNQQSWAPWHLMMFELMDELV